MKDRRTAIVLLITAVMFAIGAYMLFIRSTEDPSVVRTEVVKPVEKPKAPDWVNGGTEVKPDYSSSDTQPKDVTPPPPPPEEEKNEEETQVIEVAEDKMVTFTFVESLADFLLHRFQPVGPKGKPLTQASAMELNKYYGRELDGFATTSDDILAARKSIFDYAFNPTMLNTLYNLYAEHFIFHLVDTATNQDREYLVGKDKERRTLTSIEIKAMLTLNSRRIERTADVFRAMGDDPAITEMAARYRRAAKAVERANVQLQDAIAEEKGTAQAGERLKSAILQRERTKAQIISTLKQTCHSCTETELFYLSQWAYRRVVSDSGDTRKTFTKIADILDDLAVRFANRASQLE